MGSRDFAIANARVFDGEQVLARASVLVTGGRIEPLLRGGSFQGRGPAGTLVRQAGQRQSAAPIQ